MSDHRPERPRLVLAIVACAQFMVLLDSTVVNVALPRLSADLGFTDATRPWILDAYTLAFGGLLLLGSRAADLVGRRRIFLTGLLLFTAASAACGLAGGSGAFVAARAFQGIGAAMLSPAAFSIITTTFTEGRERHVALGVWGALGGLGATVGVVAGGLVVHLFGWPWAFFVNLPLGLAAGIAAVVVVRHDRPAAHGGGAARIDAGGGLTVTAGLLALVYTIIAVREHGWNAPITVGSAAAAAVLLALFAVVERKAAMPMLPRRLRGDRHLLVGGLGQFLVGATQLSVLFVISLQAQVALHLDPLRAGLSFVPMGVVAIASAVTASRLVQRIGSRAVYAAGSAVGLAGLLLFAIELPNQSYVGALLVPSLLVGVALPTGSVVGTIVGSTGVSAHDAGIASGILTAFFQVGSALGLAVTATVAASGLRAGYLTIAAFTALALANAAFGFRVLRPVAADELTGPSGV